MENISDARKHRANGQTPQLNTGGKKKRNRAIIIFALNEVVVSEKLGGKCLLYTAVINFAEEDAERGSPPEEDDVDGVASRGVAITWPRGTAVISRGVSGGGRNAIICRLYATIIAKVHGARKDNETACGIALTGHERAGVWLRAIRNIDIFELRHRYFILRY